MSQKQKALILGGGPAGLTAAIELLRHTDILPIVIERSAKCGGMARSYPLGSGFVDVGGHRFHTSSSRVREFWLSIMELGEDGFRLVKRNSKLYFENKFFDYPVRLTWRAISQIGFLRGIAVGLSLCFNRKIRIRSLEDFFRATYGDRLFKLFFERYTEKVWGRQSSEIPASWGGERLKRPGFETAQESFFYPTGGPGHFWDRVTQEILRLGGEIHTGTDVTSITGTQVQTSRGLLAGDYVLSTLPLSQLCEYLGVPSKVVLPARSIVSVNLVLERSRVVVPPAQWIYVNDDRLKSARLQFYRQWDESMVKKECEEIVGVEFFATPGDLIWNESDEKLVQLALSDLKAMGVYEGSASLSAVFKLRDAYPCYWGDYDKLSQLQDYVDQHTRVFSFGRQGLHRYINMDQAMMSALRVVDHIRLGGKDKKSLWNDFSDLHLPE